MLTNAQLKAKYGNIQPSSPMPKAPMTTLGSQKPGKFSIDNPELGMNLLGTAGDVFKGALKGAGSTLLNIGSLGEQGLQKLTGANVVGGQQQFNQSVSDVKNQFLTPTNTAQKVGFTGEQIGEFFIPGGAVTKAGKAIEGAKILTNLPKAVKAGATLLGKAGVEAAIMSGVTAAQGGSAKDISQNALFGAGGSIVGSTLGALKSPVSKLLQSSAESTYSKALGATTKADKALTAKVVPGLLERGVTATSRKSLLGKITNSVEAAGEQMNRVLEGIPENSPVNLTNVNAQLEQAKAAFTVPGKNGASIIADPQAVAHIEGFQNILKQIGTEDAPFSSVRKLRQIWDKGVAQAGGFHGKTLSEGSLIEAQKTATDALRSELIKGRPDLERVNKEFNFWSNAQKVIRDTVERTSSQSTPLGKQIFRAAGMAKGGLTGLSLAAIGEIAGSTAWRTVSAVTKSRLAKSLATGNLQDVVTTVTKLLGSQSMSKR